MISFSPDQESLGQVLNLLQKSQIGDNSTQKQVFSELEALSTNTEFPFYLIYILLQP
jgi:hypothetical protein